MEWNRGPTVGRGSSATVFLATTSSGELFAVKSTNLSGSSFLQREQHFLSQLSSPHIIKYMGFDMSYENQQPMYNLFMEYAPGGTLSDAIKRQGSSLDEPTIRLYTNQILQGLDYLHLNGLVHCDIKGQNVLIGKDGAIKIADLGCARLAQDGDVDGAVTSTFSGTPVFMAPEVARGEEQGFPADVWALGCTIIEMATGSNPWPETPKSGGQAKQLLQHPFLHNLESTSEEVNEFTGNSPTGVLDQEFWDSQELSESPRSLTHSSSSPAERIRQSDRRNFFIWFKSTQLELG
ncbi:hypothetical protein F0562_008778 [Nyssa sinensis]|uniref:Protein kinase domain-containing protein n=1 Tax=Nyssa sinensis TaxID=561372 RepID=A0A5J5A7V6_9ASTE|nr:hypothetical protein F0562_008778 [Nyssa sinensis]